MKRSLIFTLLLLLLVSVPSVFASCAERRSDCEDAEVATDEIEFTEPELTRLPLLLTPVANRSGERLYGRRAERDLAYADRRYRRC